MRIYCTDSISTYNLKKIIEIGSVSVPVNAPRGAVSKLKETKFLSKPPESYSCVRASRSLQIIDLFDEEVRIVFNGISN